MFSTINNLVDLATHVFLKVLYEGYFLKEKKMYIISAFFAQASAKKSELLVHFWSTYSVCDFDWGASDGPAKGQESSENSS